MKYTFIKEGAKSEDYLYHCLKNLYGKTMVDIGCGHGGHSLYAARLGIKCTGIDSRVSMPIDNVKVKWKIQNVNEVEFNYDIVLASGILYHLTKEEQINLFDKINAKTLIVNTHFAILDENNNPINKDFENLLIKDNEYGCLYDERADYKERASAAFNNQYSYWHTFESLIELLEKKYSVEVLTPFVTDDRCWINCKKYEI